MAGEYTAKMNSGWVPLTGPKMASICSGKRIGRAATPHPSPKARAKNGPSDLMVISLRAGPRGRAARASRRVSVIDVASHDHARRRCLGPVTGPSSSANPAEVLQAGLLSALAGRFRRD